MQKGYWTKIIKPKERLHLFNPRELYAYRDLIGMLIKRDIATLYKQTVLGPLWLVLNPLLTSALFSVIFGNIAGFSTDGRPRLLFYMSGTTLWTLFSSCLNNSAATFTANSAIFGKVYFPRLIVPIAYSLYACFRFLIQFGLFLLFYFFYLFFTDAPLYPTAALLMIPYLVIATSLLGTGTGLIVTSLTTKYKDFALLLAFAVQLWMYATPVVFPMSATSGIVKTLLLLNPMTPIVEAFRYAFMGTENFSPFFLAIGACTTLILVMTGLVLFERTQQTFVDTI